MMVSAHIYPITLLFLGLAPVQNRGARDSGYWFAFVGMFDKKLPEKHIIDFYEIDFNWWIINQMKQMTIAEF